MFTTALQKIVSFKTMETGWNGMGAKKVSGKAIRRAIELLCDLGDVEHYIRGLAVCPNVDGTIGIEIDLRKTKLVITVPIKTVNEFHIMIITNTDNYVTDLWLSPKEICTHIIRKEKEE